ncbi:MAG TPA: glycosyltransferase family 39 protein, partial [Thermoleophilaceae bacterium]|nr:glycosyltransferase family 39 protein [Thermoleophilaceae bacterium]
MRPTRPQLLLIAVVVAGAALRFATLDVQSFWIDEGYTVRLLRMDLGGLLDGIPRTEGTPPLYYVLAWLWTRPFGTGEVGVRSLSALLGTATIPVAYAVGRRLVSVRAGLIVAALAASSPLLVWYAQEARSYALLILLSVLATLYFLRALEGDGYAAWGLASAAALATHYYALFFVAPQALWLLLRSPDRRRAALATAGAGAVGALLLPLAIDQSHNYGARFIRFSDLGDRLLQVPKQFLVGYDLPSEVAFTAAAAALTAAALVLLVTRADAHARAGARTAAALTAAIVGLPLVVAIAGADYFIARNVITALVPFFVVLAAGFAATRRAGPALAVALCGVFVGATLVVEANPEYQRNDWRGAARALGPPRVTRAVVVTPLNGRIPLNLYARGLRPFPSGGLELVPPQIPPLPDRGVTRTLPLSEVDLLAVAERRPGQT